MSQTQYSPINGRPEEGRVEVKTSDGPSTTLVKACNDEAQSPTPLNPYVPQESWLYLQFFVPLLIISIFPAIFAIVVYTSGQVPAPEWLSDFTRANPRTTPQIVTILASILTATIRWSLGGAAALLSRKRLLAPRPIFEINMFFSLRSISGIWDWKHQRRMTALTWLLVVLYGLLTSGFVGLLNPIQMQIITPLSTAQELNLFTTSDVCTRWYDNEVPWWLTLVPVWEGLKVRTWGIDPFDVTSFTRVMAMHYFLSKNPSKGHFVGGPVNLYQDLNYTRVVGSTAGALITGPLGLGDVLGFPSLSPKNPSNLSYSLDLQGFWIDASCSYSKAIALDVTWGEVIDDEIQYHAACPGSSTSINGTAIYLEDYGGVLLGTLGLDCTLENGTRALLFREFLLRKSSSKNLDYMKCDISPIIGDVKAVLNPDLQAFTTSKPSPTITSLPPATSALTTAILSYILPEFQRLGAITLELERVVEFHTGNPRSEPSVMWQELVELVIKGLFEIQASVARRHITEDAMSAMRAHGKIPSECLRQVQVELNERTIGWEVKWATWLGLLPLLIVCIIAFTIITLAVIAKGKLTLFDPMNPVSLIAATSIGEVIFSKQTPVATVGDPLDENVLITKVSYGKEGETWGLRSLAG